MSSYPATKENFMNEYFKEFLTEFSPQIEVTSFPPSYLKNNETGIPDALLNFWSEAGASGYAEGILWSTNPEEFEPVLECWLGGAALWNSDKYTVVARSSFGELFVWGKNTGMSIVIHSLSSSITTKEPDMKKGTEDAEISAFFLSKDISDFDFFDVKEKYLFSRALKKLGRLKADEIYGFEPALCMGGLPKIENLVKVKMIEHLVLLSQMSDIEFTHLNFDRYN